MKNYIISIIIIGVIGSLVTLLSPDGEGGGLKKHVGLAVGLCMILFFATPIMSLMQSISELDVSALVPKADDAEIAEYESIFESGLSAAEVENLREGIANILRERFEIEAEQCLVTVKITSDGSGKRELGRVFIRLFGTAIWKDTGEIERYLEELLGCDVTTAVG